MHAPATTSLYWCSARSWKFLFAKSLTARPQRQSLGTWPFPAIFIFSRDRCFIGTSNIHRHCSAIFRVSPNTWSCWQPSCLYCWPQNHLSNARSFCWWFRMPSSRPRSLSLPIFLFLYCYLHNLIFTLFLRRLGSFLFFYAFLFLLLGFFWLDILGGLFFFLFFRIILFVFDIKGVFVFIELFIRS